MVEVFRMSLAYIPWNGYVLNLLFVYVVLLQILADMLIRIHIV